LLGPYVGFTWLFTRQSLKMHPEIPMIFWPQHDIPMIPGNPA